MEPVPHTVTPAFLRFYLLGDTDKQASVSNQHHKLPFLWLTMKTLHFSLYGGNEEWFNRKVGCHSKTRQTQALASTGQLRQGWGAFGSTRAPTAGALTPRDRDAPAASLSNKVPTGSRAKRVKPF